MSIDQIKFRGQLRGYYGKKDKYAGEWITTDDVCEYVNSSIAAIMMQFWYLVQIKLIDPATVGQWSTRKATNGEDIYAGHYVRVEFPRDDTPGCVVEGAVVMLDGVFTIYQGDEGICLLHKCYSTDQEIIIEIIEEASDG